MWYILFLVILTSCGHSSSEGYHDEAKGVAKAITYQLRSVNSLQDLQKKKPLLRSQFNNLVDIMIASSSLEHNKESFSSGRFDELREELERVYRIPGARKVVEECQDEALNRLDLHGRQKNLQIGGADH